MAFLILPGILGEPMFHVRQRGVAQGAAQHSFDARRMELFVVVLPVTLAQPLEDGGDTQTALERGMTDKYGPRTERYDMRQRRERDYSHLFANTDTFTDVDVADNLETDEPLATPQMSMKKGLKIFGKHGVEAVKKEMLQLHERKVMEPRHAAELSPAQKQEALAYLMFLKRKRCGKIKGRGCADGRKQRAYTSREDAASPTVATESVFLTTVIDALEGRDASVN